MAQANLLHTGAEVYFLKINSSESQNNYEPHTQRPQRNLTNEPGPI